MLLNLHKIRQNTDWTSLWHTVIKENLERLKETTLADQDVINAIIKKFPQIVFNISCKYNVQMSMQTLAKNCYKEDVRSVKVWKKFLFSHHHQPSKLNQE